MEERIQTHHPEGKQAPSISKAKYDLMRDAITQTLAANGPMSYADLRRSLEDQLSARFDGSISWYYTVVKLDLEARGVLARAPARAAGKGSHLVRLTAQV